ncbi:hypothetical protein [Providencia rustigianii]|uniref:hypothetical protein n=2 Tax=Providencia rustigianii TaxID=158850 RepID=UPI000D94824D|nr:hypothetical protein [Providencia rustigianii]SPY77441.1 Uncharacterised protein [Providencia rustigianii]
MSHLMDKNRGEVIIIFTESWRYLVIGSLLALIGQFSLFFGFNAQRWSLFIGTGLFTISQYYIYRLWLDNHFFKLIYRQGNTDAFDDASKVLFPKKSTHKSMDERWIGTRNLFNRACYLVLTLWIWLLLSIVFS